MPKALRGFLTIEKGPPFAQRLWGVSYQKRRVPPLPKALGGFLPKEKGPPFDISSLEEKSEGNLKGYKHAINTDR